jgi:hypothetical protein
MSVNTTSPRIMIPPPPIPWILRPTIRIERLWAVQQTVVPAVKIPSDVRRQIERPKISLTAAIIGIVTAHVRRYDVPIQKPSVAVP